MVAAHAQAALEAYESDGSVASDDSELVAAQRMAAKSQSKKHTTVNKVRGAQPPHQGAPGCAPRKHKVRALTRPSLRRRASCAGSRNCRKCERPSRGWSAPP